MRIDREALQALRVCGRTAARAWAIGCAREALDEIGRSAGAPEFRSPGTEAISPQAATHLGRAIAEALGEEADGSETTLTLAAALLASPNPSLRMVGPHLLTPLARERPACAGRVMQLADLCADPAATAALAIPLAAAVTRDLSAAAASLGQAGDSARRRLALQATRQALATRNPELARMLSDAIAKAARNAPPAD
ncbi:MAG: hypothetical protein OXG33_02680 [Chloroflexi bacterium]|nr:hypothetical protein [Chloroflexota bacterium]